VPDDFASRDGDTLDGSPLDDVATDQESRDARTETRSGRRATARRAGERKKPRWGRRILAVLLGILFLGVALVAAFLLFLNHKVESNVRHEALLPTPSASGSLGTDAEVLASKGMNVLMVGNDARPGDTVSRSDVMVLAHIPDDKSKVFLIHFPRDLWMDIPGHGQAKLNAAYAYGGAPLLVQTLQDKLRIRIDHVAKTDFEGFSGMVDAVGGVRVYSEEASSGQGTGYAVQQGWNDLNGKAALSFVRERYELSEGDISRGRRQQALIKALLMKTISPEVITNPLKIAEFTDAATKNLIVDNAMTTSFMREEAFALRNVRSGDVVFITAPYTGFGWSADGQSIDIVDEAGMADLGDAIRRSTLGDYKKASVLP